MSVTQLRATIAGQLVGRDREAHLLALAFIAREHVLLVGPPGTAKSHLCRTGASAVSGARYCERLLSPTTPPEAVFGPVSLAALREDRYEHVTDGYAADAHFLYLDEVGRAGPAILDTLLHLLGPERQALIGTKQVQAPLVTAIGSANSWPEDAAMMDRWLLRATVNYLPPSERRELLTFAPPPMAAVLTLAELAEATAASKRLAWSTAAAAAFDNILADMDDAGIQVSDRRLRASDKIARAAAILNGRTDEIMPGDLAALQFVLWNNPEQAPKATEIVLTHAAPLGGKLQSVMAEAMDLDKEAKTNPVERPTVLAKLSALVSEVAALEALPEARDPRAIADIALARRLLEAVTRRTNTRLLGIPETKLPPLPRVKA